MKKINTVRNAVAGVALVGAIMVGGAAVASAQTESAAPSTSSSSTTSDSTTTDSGSGNTSPSGPAAPHEHTDVTGDELTSVTDAVTAYDSSITVEQVQKDPDGSYDVTGTKDGSDIRLEVSADLQTVTEGRGGPGGGRGPGGTQDTEVTGDVATSVANAVTAQDSAVTVEKVMQDPDGSYDALGTKDGERIAFDVSADLQTVTERQGGSGGPGGHGAPAGTGASDDTESSDSSGTTTDAPSAGSSDPNSTDTGSTDSSGSASDTPTSGSTDTGSSDAGSTDAGSTDSGAGTTSGGN